MLNLFLKIKKFLPRLSGKCGEAQAGTPAPRFSLCYMA
jgi:hypothetical protein